MQPEFKVRNLWSELRNCIRTAPRISLLILVAMFLAVFFNDAIKTLICLALLLVFGFAFLLFLPALIGATLGSAFGAVIRQFRCWRYKCNYRIIRLFIYSAGVLLLATAVAKLVSASGSAHVLQNSDPIFSISFRDVFRIVGTLELIVAIVCLLGRRMGLQIGLVACLSTNFVLYRFFLFWIGWHKPCPCLGNLTDALHIPPQIADMTMKIILAYLLIGSYATLFWLWRQRKKSVPSIA